MRGENARDKDRVMHCRDYLRTTAEIALKLDPLAVEAQANEL